MGVRDSAEMARLKRKLGVECLWVFILSLLQEEPVYAYELQGLLEKEFGLKASRIISYRVLYPLEARGFVSSFTKEVDGRVRKYYELTSSGKQLLSQGKSFIAGTGKKL
jgi:DNA-binding PadR family transcriptional regulator